MPGDLVNRLADGDPPILVAQGAAREGAIGLSPMTLREEQAQAVVDRLTAVLTPVAAVAR